MLKSAAHAVALLCVGSCLELETKKVSTHFIFKHKICFYPFKNSSGFDLFMKRIIILKSGYVFH